MVGPPGTSSYSIDHEEIFCDQAPLSVHCVMNLVEVLIVSFGLAADALAVSIVVGSSGLAADRRSAIRLAFHLGLFQFLMPVIGWHLGVEVEKLIEHFDHWVAFGLLAIVGGRMIHAAFSAEGATIRRNPTKGASLVVLSVATSIDALAVGFGMALFRIPIWEPGVIIGLVTATLSFIGVRLGSKVKRGYGRTMELIGGVVLICIGLRILYEHIGI
jgi:putative Mn2+ efflux pump MntP